MNKARGASDNIPGFLCPPVGGHQGALGLISIALWKGLEYIRGLTLICHHYQEIIYVILVL